MAGSLRAIGVVLGVLLGLFWAEAALAQCTGSDATSLALTGAGSASGFGLSTFACGLPGTGASGSVGTGEAYSSNPTTGNVLVTDTSSSDLYSFSSACALDGGCTAAESQNYATAETGTISLGPITSAFGSEYSIDTINSDVDTALADGDNSGTTNDPAGALSSDETYAVANIGGTLFVLGTGPGSDDPGVYYYAGSSLEYYIDDTTSGLDALAGSYDSNTGDGTIYVGSDTSGTDAIDAYDLDTTDLLFSVPQLDFGSGVTGLYVMQTGDLAGELLVETATDVDLYCVTSNAYGCTQGDVVTLANGGTDGSTIGSDFNTVANLGEISPYDCTTQDYDAYTCAETMYLSQGDDLDQLTYNGSPLSQGVPEPASMTLFGAGLLGLGYLRRRRSA